MSPPQTAEHRRLADSQARRADWKHWGPYLSERAWGTVREDYSATGQAWEYLPHDHARSRAYRWNEDGLAGVCRSLLNERWIMDDPARLPAVVQQMMADQHTQRKCASPQKQVRN